MEHARAIPATAVYRPLDFVVVRAPLLPVDAYVALASSQSSNKVTESGPEGEMDPPVFRALRDPLVREAIAVASPSLMRALERAQAGLLSRKASVRARSSLLRYLIRMSVRSTPYGLFAGAGIAGWGSKTNLALETDPDKPVRRKQARPDMAWLLGYVRQLEAIPPLRRYLRLVANPAVFVHAGRAGLFSRSSLSKEPQTFRVSVRATRVVRLALELARTPTPYSEVAEQILSATPGATAEQVEHLLTELCEQTLLLTDLRPPLTTTSPALYVIERLAAVPGPEAEQARTRLRSLLDGLTEWQDKPAEESVRSFRALEVLAREISAADEDEPVLQVDSALLLAQEHEQISEVIGAEAVRAAELLLKLSPWPNGPPYLSHYRRRFIDRYGHDREVPLLQLLDKDAGLGPPTQEVAGAGVDPRVAEKREQALLDLACRALYEHTPCVELDDATLARLQTWDPSSSNAPLSLDINVLVAARSAEDIDTGAFTLVVGPNLGGHAAGRHLSRLAGLLGERATGALARAAHAEEEFDSGHVRAELSYLPRGLRMANVMVRPLVRPYELALGVSAAEPARVIPLSDLVVGVRSSRFYLKWASRQVEVEVCSGHMLNAFSAPGIYRFLHELSLDGLANFLPFDWGPAERFPYLPRVQVGKVVLRPAQWTFSRAAPEAASASGFPEAIACWRERWRVPRYIMLTDLDNRLLLDLDDPLQVEEMRQEAYRTGGTTPVVLQEALPAPEEFWLDGPGGRYACELVVPLVQNKKDVKLTTPFTSASSARPQTSTGLQSPPEEISPSVRLRAPGSDWLYAKLYCSPDFEDDIICGPIHDFSEGALLSGFTSEWFFIRYADPEPHLRLRFHGEPSVLQRMLLPALCESVGKLVDEGLCSRFTLDTYEREIERFGGLEAMAVAESIFAADSRAVAELLWLQLQRPGEQCDRTLLAAANIDRFLDGMGLSLSERHEWCARIPRAGRGAGREYRVYKQALRRLVLEPSSLTGQPNGAQLERVLSKRGDALKPLAHRLRNLMHRDALGKPFGEVISSLVHLSCNRIMRADPRTEQQLIDLLLRVYEGLLKTGDGSQLAK